MRTRILIVDDEPDILEFLNYNFRKSGFEVDVASNGIHALAVIEKRIPDLIICDILMPLMNGPSFIRQMKSNTLCNHIPVIFLSASSDDYDILGAMDSGGTEFISKPVKFHTLLEHINEMLEK